MTIARGEQEQVASPERSLLLTDNDSRRAVCFHLPDSMTTCQSCLPANALPVPLGECHKVPELQGMTEAARGGLPIGLVVVLRVLSESLVELDTLDQRFRT